ncbi:hypothetical protein ACOSQ2_023256 [Xanthoceras sorbifolium]
MSELLGAASPLLANQYALLTVNAPYFSGCHIKQSGAGSEKEGSERIAEASSSSKLSRMRDTFPLPEFVLIKETVASFGSLGVDRILRGGEQGSHLSWYMEMVVPDTTRHLKPFTNNSLSP